MSKNIIFAEGLLVKDPHKNAPSFSVVNISINVTELISFLEENENEKGWVNLNVNRSKTGKLYASLY